MLWIFRYIMGCVCIFILVFCGYGVFDILSLCLWVFYNEVLMGLRGCYWYLFLGLEDVDYFWFDGDYYFLLFFMGLELGYDVV